MERYTIHVLQVIGFVIALHGVSGLQCPSCSHLTVTEVPGLVKTVVDTALGVFQDVKCSQNLDGPTSEVREETCAPPSGKTARCSWYKGTLTMKVPIIGTEIPFHVDKRACYYAAAAAVPDNGCHDLDNLNEDQSYLQDIISSLNSVLNLHSFKGERCITSETYGDPSLAVTCVSQLSIKFLIGWGLAMFVLKYIV